MDNGAIEEEIKKILSAPDVDLATISSKKVRAQLAEQFGSSVIKQNKEAIDALVIDLYNRIVNATGVAEQDVKQEEAEQRQQVKEEPPTTNGHAPLHPVHTNASRPKQAVKAEPPASDASSEEDEDEDASASDYDEDKKDVKPSTSSFSKPKPKSSPQKRRLQEDAVPPASSQEVPLAMITAQTDEEYARQLQEEMNAALRGRSTRGGGFQKKSSKKGGSSKKAGGGSKKKYRSKDYIDDSDAGEGHDRGEGSEEDDDDDGDASVTDKKPKRKRAAGTGSGGYMKELALSEPLQRVCGAETMPRPSIVKHLWAYIREHSLQNPAKKSEIMNDELFIEIFGVKTMTMFSMNKYLKKAVKPIDG